MFRFFLLFMDSFRSSRWPCLSSFFCSMSCPAPVFPIFDPLYMLTIPVLFLFVCVVFSSIFCSSVLCPVYCVLYLAFLLVAIFSLINPVILFSICCPVRLLSFCPGYVFRPVFYSTNATFFVELVPKKKSRHSVSTISAALFCSLSWQWHSFYSTYYYNIMSHWWGGVGWGGGGGGEGQGWLRLVLWCS